jgi:teichuronic acid biosynthesis glycosyltransferase TuaC
VCDRDRRLRLLTYTTLYPNAQQPIHGVFVENRLRHLVAESCIDTTVVAPVPWFPISTRRLGRWSIYAEIAREEQRHGMRVLHPRFPVIPKFGTPWAPWLLYRATRPVLAALIAQGTKFDALDAHYMYPDGVAAVWLGREFGLPVVVTCRGSDLTLLPRYYVPRSLIRRAISGAAALVTVSTPLRNSLIELGAPPDKVTVLRNGVDLTMFRPLADRDAERHAWRLSGPTLVSVGQLIHRKGHDRTIAAMRFLPDCSLMIAGEGPEHAKLGQLIDLLGLRDRVRLLGRVPHTDLPTLYGIADATILSSTREGWANVLLESMACGTPVIASDIPGNTDVVCSPDAGLITRENTSEGIADGVKRLLAAPPPRFATRSFAERFSWDATTAGQLALFRRIVDPGGRTEVEAPQPARPEPSAITGAQDRKNAGIVTTTCHTPRD